MDDIERINENINTLNEIFVGAGYVDLVPNLDFSEGELTTLAKLNTVRDRVEDFRSRFSESIYQIGTPETPETLNFMTLNKANYLEKILLDIEIMLKNMAAVYVPSGIWGSGGVIYRSYNKVEVTE